MEMLGLETRELRWLQADLIYAHKMLFSRLEIAPSSLLGALNNITGGHAYELFMPYCCSDVDAHIYFFSCRVVQLCYAVKLSSSDMQSLKRFKWFVRNVDLSQHVRMYC
jgi:hypothetical protein